MNVAALYDIHGNLPALEAVLDHIAQLKIDLIVVGGDIAAGPMPRATLDRLRALGDRVRFVRGNADREMVNAFDGDALADLPPFVAEITRWAAHELDRSARDFLAQLPLTLTINVDGLGDVLFCHASPRSDTDLFTVRTPADRLRPKLADVTQRLVVCGHTHMQFDRTVDHVRLVNAGSVGMPYGDPGAYWAVLGPDVTLMCTPYDRERAAAKIMTTAYPHAQDFAQNNVLHPPTADEALAVFEPNPH